MSGTTTPARYAKGKLAVRPEKDGTGFMTREARLAGALGYWSNRERAYILTPGAVRKWERYVADPGYDVNLISGKLCHRGATLDL
jgi:hypothetical protein